MSESEPLLEKQLRLLLEQQGAELFGRLYVGPLRAHDLTVLAFDLGEKGHVAFKTSLLRPGLVEMMEGMIASFSGGPPRFAPAGMSHELLRLLGTTAKELLPAGIGYVIVIGDAARSAYVSNGNRADVCTMIEAELLPNWREL